MVTNNVVLIAILVYLAVVVIAKGEIDEEDPLANENPENEGKNYGNIEKTTLERYKKKIYVLIGL